MKQNNGFQKEESRRHPQLDLYGEEREITTIQIKLPLNKEVYTQTMLMARHQKIAKLFDEDFWVTQ